MTRKKYTGFISYSHVDSKIANKIFKKLESWNIDKTLFGRMTSIGSVPKSLRPIFRDRDELSAALPLRNSILDALENSEFLIVLCSATSRDSQYVNEEIVLFSKISSPKRIIPVIIADQPDIPNSELFPAELQNLYSSHQQEGVFDDVPIAADIRAIGDGYDRALAKIVAALLGLPLDLIIQRELRNRNRKRSFLLGGITGASLFALIFGVVSFYSYREARETIEKSVFSVGSMIVNSHDSILYDFDSEQNETSDYLLIQCELLWGMAGDSVEIGVREETLCNLERLLTQYYQTEDGAVLNQAENLYLDLYNQLITVNNPDKDLADAAAMSAIASFNLYAIHKKLSENDAVKGSREQKLRLLIDRLSSVIREKPDNRALSDFQENPIWSLINLLEDRNEWVSSYQQMVMASEDRGFQLEYFQSVSLSENEDHLAILFQNIIYLRRISWVLLNHLNDIGLAKEFANRTSINLQKVGELSDDEYYKENFNVNYEYCLVNSILSAADEVSEKLDSARTYAEVAVEYCQRALEFDQMENDLILEVKNEITLLNSVVEKLERQKK